MKRSSRKKTVGMGPAGGREKAGIELTGPLNPDRARILSLICLAIVTVLSGTLAVLYFGHQTVPNSDFTAFFDTGKSILSFELPSSFKRLPGLGVLQVALSGLVGGQHPGLTAGWLLNSVVFVATGVLLYLIGTQILGTAGIWFTLLVLINPMVLRWMQHPIAETTFIFFIVLTFYLLLRPTRWAYAAAMMTSMVRYEGAILILLCFCYDVYMSKGWKSRLLGVVRAGLAGLPLALWMLGMVVNRPAGASASSIPYVKNFAVTKQMVIGKFFNIVWSNGVGSLFALPGSNEQMQAIAVISKTVLVLALVLALVFCIVRRQWRVMLLFGFFGLFCLLHAIRTYTMPRYGLPVVWVTLLIAIYGLKSGWDWLVERKVLPAVLQGLLKVVVIIAALVWFGFLLKFLPKYMPLSRASVSVPYLTIAAVFVILAVRLVLGGFSGQKLLAAAAVFSTMGLIVTSNQFELVQKVGNGSIDREFKMLADWYHENAEEGDILLTTLPHVVTLFLPDEMDPYIQITQRIPGQTPEEFLQNCHQRKVRYLTWDSRIGLTPDNTYYRRWKMERIAFLQVPRNYGPLKFIHQIQNEDYRYRFINIYELMPIPAAGQKAPAVEPK